MAIPPNFNPVVQHLTAAVELLDDDLQTERAAHAQTRAALNGVTQQLAQQQLANGLAVLVIHQTTRQRDALQARLDELSSTCPVRAMNSVSRLKRRAVNYLNDHKFAVVGVACVIAAGLTDNFIKSMS